LKRTTITRLRLGLTAVAVTAAVAAGGVMTALNAGATTAPPAADAVVTTVTYPGSDAVLANPERGFMHFKDCSGTPLTVTEMQSWREDGITQVFCMFYLRDFRDRDLDDATLSLLQRQFDAVRAARMTVILRFAYTDDESGEDAAPARVLRHIAQLKPVLTTNAYVIGTIQAGFIGAWGEWYYTKNFGNAGKISATDAANRKAVVEALLDALPATRTVQVRTPGFKRSFYGPEPQTGDANGARVGHHNDCFLASADDFGTYVDPAVERPYLAADSAYLPVGGETCAVNPPRSECASAIAEMTRFHWSYLNADYQPDVLASWRTGGCMPEVQKRLGYRFALTEGSFGVSGRTLAVRISVRNDGFAAPYNPRLAQLVLRDEAGTVTRLPLRSDPRRWAAGTTTVIEESVAVPPGRFQLGLALPDATSALETIPEYAIRTANSGLWNADGGYNDLKATVTVS
jgi:hypothetical protein